MSTESASLIVRLIDKVTGPSRKISRSIAAIEKATGSMDKVSGDAAKSISSLGKAGSITGGILKANLIMAAAKSVVQLTGSVMGSAVEAVNFGQQYKIAFDQLAKHGADGNRLFEHSARLAARYGLEVQGTTKAFSKFLALQFNPRQAEELIKMGADLQALGNSADDVQGVFLALGQIKSKGKLQGEELMQLQERGISGQLIKDSIAKQMGVAFDEIEGLQRQGKISAEVGIQAIMDAVNHKLGQENVGEAGKRFADNTLAGLTNRMKANATILQLKITESLGPALTKGMGDLFQKMNSFISSPKGERFISVLSGALASLGTVVSEMAPILFDFIVAVGGEAFSMFKDMSSGLSVSSGGMATFKTILTGLIKPMGQLLGILGYAAVAFGVVIAGASGVAAIIFGTLWKAIAGIGNLFVAMIGETILFADNFMARFRDLPRFFTELGTMIVTGLVNGIKSMFGFATSVATSLGSSVINSFKSVLGIASPSKEFMKLGAFSGEGFVEGLNSSMAPANDISVDPKVSGIGNVGALAGVSGAGGSFNISVNVSVNGSGSPKETAEEVASSVRREMESLLRQYAHEAA